MARAVLPPIQCHRRLPRATTTAESSPFGKAPPSVQLLLIATATGQVGKSTQTQAALQIKSCTIIQMLQQIPDVTQKRRFSQPPAWRKRSCRRGVQPGVRKRRAPQFWPIFLERVRCPRPPRQLFLDLFVAAIDVIDAVDPGGALATRPASTSAAEARRSLAITLRLAVPSRPE
jgi:hypothetical protein